MIYLFSNYFHSPDKKSNNDPGYFNGGTYLGFLSEFEVWDVKILKYLV